MKKLYSCIVLSTLLIASPAMATSLTDLFSGQTLVVGDKEFINWSLEANIYNFDLTKIDVTGINIDPLNPGLRYAVSDDELKVEGEGITKTLSFFFDIRQEDDLALIKDNTLLINEFTDYAFDGEGSTDGKGEVGHISVSEIVKDAAGSEITRKSVDVYEQRWPSTFSVNEVFDPVSLLNIRTGIVIETGPDDNLYPHYANLLGFEQYFSQNEPQDPGPDPVPEPATMFLLGTGLVGVAGAARKRKKKQA